MFCWQTMRTFRGRLSKIKVYLISSHSSIALKVFHQRSVQHTIQSRNRYGSPAISTLEVSINETGIFDSVVKHLVSPVIHFIPDFYSAELSERSVKDV